jgi:hypothetical protein
MRGEMCELGQNDELYIANSDRRLADLEDLWKQNCAFKISLKMRPG